MYDRMLDKQHQPTEDEFFAYCGACGALFAELNSFLLNELKADRQMRFPYGNHYGWSMKYAIKSKLICDVFAEQGAFTVTLRLSDAQYKQVYDGLSVDAKALIDNKYPCGDSGWIHFRVLTQRHNDDVKKLLMQKVSVKTAAKEMDHLRPQ